MLDVLKTLDLDYEFCEDSMLLQLHAMHYDEKNKGLELQLRKVGEIESLGLKMLENRIVRSQGIPSEMLIESLGLKMLENE